MVIPVVFHIISNDPSTITDQQIIDAVADLNDAFAHTGPYASGGDGVNTGIRFCLAKIAPDGGNTTGITRTNSVLSDFDSDLEDDRLKNLVSWNTHRILQYLVGERCQKRISDQFFLRTMVEAS